MYKKVITNAHIEGIRVIESSRDASYQIHHPNDFLVRGRVFVYFRPQGSRDIRLRIKCHLHRIEKSEKIILNC